MGDLVSLEKPHILLAEGALDMVLGLIRESLVPWQRFAKTADYSPCSAMITSSSLLASRHCATETRCAERLAPVRSTL